MGTSPWRSLEAKLHSNSHKRYTEHSRTELAGSWLNVRTKAAVQSTSGRKAEFLFRDLRLLSGNRIVLCLSFLTITSLIAVCQPQAQPGSDSTPANAAAAPKTSSVSPGERVILKVGSLKITQAVFEQWIADLEAQQGPADLSRKKLGDNYASLLMLSQQAIDNHLDTSPEVVRQLAIDRMQILSNAEFARLKEKAAPTPEQINAYYQAHLADYDEVHIRRVFIWSTEDKANGVHKLTPEQAKALADEVRKALSSGGDVDKVIQATPHSDTDVVADAQPLVFQRGDLPEKMNTAAFSLKQGGWTEFSDVPGIYVFIQLVATSRRDLSDVKPQIVKKLQAEKLLEELDAVKKDTGIWMDEEYFASKAPVPASTTQPETSGQGVAGKERGEK